jgi:hypothetical protein
MVIDMLLQNGPLDEAAANGLRVFRQPGNRDQ